MSLKYKDDEGTTHNFGAFTTNIENTFDGTSENAMSGVAIQSVLDKKQDTLIAGSYIKIMPAGSIEKNVETDVYPINFMGDGNPLINYKIQGNLSQTGTPNVDTPIDVLGVGENFKIINNDVETNIYLTSPLYKIGNYIDTLDYSKRQIRRNTRRANLSTLNWSVASVSGGKNRFGALLPDYDPGVTAGRSSNIYFNRFHFSSNQDEYGIGFGHYTKMVYIYVSENVKTIAQLQEWLIENESYLVYPIVGEYTEAIEALPQISTIDGSNSISISSNVRPYKVGIDYTQKYEGETTGYVISCDGLEELINRIIDERDGK